MNRKACFAAQENQPQAATASRTTVLAKAINDARLSSKVYELDIQPGRLYTDRYYYQYIGNSVRLVQDVQ